MSSSLYRSDYPKCFQKKKSSSSSFFYQHSKPIIYPSHQSYLTKHQSQQNMNKQMKQLYQLQLFQKSQSANSLYHRRAFSTIDENQLYDNTFVNVKPTTYQDLSNSKHSTFYQTSPLTKSISNLQQRKSNKAQKKQKFSINQSKLRQKKLDGSWLKIKKIIGKGKYGKVYVVSDRKTGFILALKVIQKKKIKQSLLLDQFIRQLKIQFYLNHPGIIKLYGFFHDLQNFYLLMEYASDGQLYDQLLHHKLFNQKSTSYITRTLLQITNYMHNQKILHRDIKPQNIVLILGNLKICDLGWAVYNSTEFRSTFCGTPLYFSPQLLTGQYYDQKVDLWAIGIIAYQLLFGTSPFNLKHVQDLNKIVTNEIQFPIDIKITLELKNFMKLILQKNPKNRPSSLELLHCQFIKKYYYLQVCSQLCTIHKSKSI